MNRGLDGEVNGKAMDYSNSYPNGYLNEDVKRSMHTCLNGAMNCSRDGYPNCGLHEDVNRHVNGSMNEDIARAMKSGACAATGRVRSTKDPGRIGLMR
jgi:hypothetical protein